MLAASAASPNDNAIVMRRGQSRPGQGQFYGLWISSNNNSGGASINRTISISFYLHLDYGYVLYKCCSCTAHEQATGGMEIEYLALLGSIGFLYLNVLCFTANGEKFIKLKFMSLLKGSRSI